MVPRTVAMMVLAVASKTLLRVAAHKGVLPDKALNQTKLKWNGSS